MNRRYLRRRRRAAHRRLFSPRFEALEPRELLAGNLMAVNLELVDSLRNPIPTPVAGQEFYIKANWTSSDLAAFDNYLTRFVYDNRLATDSSNFSGSTGTNVPLSTTSGPWYAARGENLIEVIVDADDNVVETEEADNVVALRFTSLPPTTLPSRFQVPLVGDQNVDWSITRYNDVDPTTGLASDYRGGYFSSDGHIGVDYVISNFSEMDAGVPVVAASGGVVTAVLDGNPDREITLGGGLATDGFVLEGSGFGDFSGSAMSEAGDLNGDGRSDFVVTAPLADSGGRFNNGVSYVLFGTTGGVPKSFDLSTLLPANGGDGSLGFVLNGINSRDNAGFSVSHGGDVNGDGVDDLILGAPYADQRGFNSGQAYVIFGHNTPSAPVFNISSLLSRNGGAGTTGFILNGANPLDQAGQSVATTDLNDDGIRDIVVGVPGADTLTAIQAGSTYVLFGRKTPFLPEIELDSLLEVNGGDGKTGVVFHGANDFDRSGNAVNTAGDINSDGIEDLIIGASAASPGTGPRAGQAYVLFGKRLGWTAEMELSTLFPLNGSTGVDGFIINGRSADDALGRPLGSAGDFNGDGLDDLILGAPQADGLGIDKGEAYVVFGRTTTFGPLFDLDTLFPANGGDGSKGVAILGENSFDNAGTSAAAVGDVNGDGLDDLLIGAPYSDLSNTDSGAAFLVYGRLTLPPTIDLSAISTGNGVLGSAFVGRFTGDAAGSAVSGAGDINSDGFADIVIGAPNAAGAGFLSGESYVVYGTSNRYGGQFKLEKLLEKPANFVEIDHGNGWKTRYSHLATNAITVQVGQPVTAGQILGLVGSSGQSVQPHLNFDVFFNGFRVETFEDPTSYWLAPLPYQGDTPEIVIDRGVTNTDPVPDLLEHPSDIEILHPTFDGPISYWYRITHLNRNDEFQVIWHRPDSTIIRGRQQCIRPKFFTNDGRVCNVRHNNPFNGARFTESLEVPWSQFPGEWKVGLVVNGVEQGLTSFHITSQPLVPAIRVSNEDGILVNGRTTPLEFGGAPLLGTGPTQTLTLQNHGSGVLHPRNLLLPAGFSLIGTFPSLINPREQAEIVVQLDTTSLGTKFGELSFETDDPDAALYRFNLTGDINGIRPAGSPQIALLGPEASYRFQAPPQVLDSLATFADADSLNFQNGSLNVAVVSGVASDDRLGIRNQGVGSDEIGVQGSTVTYQGLGIGTLAGGSGAAPLVVLLNVNADRPAVQALIRNITFENVAAVATTQRRYVRFSVIDDTGKVSNEPIKTVVVAADLLNQLPVVGSITADPTSVTKPGTVTLTADAVADQDGTVASVSFYLETNSLLGLQTGSGGDLLIATDTVGADGFSTILNTASVSGGPRTVYAQALDDEGGFSQPVSTGVTVIEPNDPPTIVFLSATPTQVLPPAPIQLEAQGVLDSDGVPARVDFYVESNQQPGLQTGADTLIGSDFSVIGGWSITWDTTGLADNNYQLYAQAMDNRGGLSAAVSTTATVGNPPPVNAIFELSRLLAQNGGDGSEGFIVNGIDAGDGSGYSVSSAGDVNRDGFDDFLIGARTASPGSPARNSAGETYVVFGKGANSLPELELSALDGTNGFKISGIRFSDFSGVSVAEAGDVNGDGFADVLIGAYGANRSGGLGDGEGYLIYGKASGFAAELNLGSLDGTNGVRIPGLSSGQTMGFSVSGAGDVNGDGFSDVLLGVTPTSGDVRGYLIFGRASGGLPSPFNLASLDGSNGFRIDGMPGTGINTLTQVAGGADVNGDGLSDVVVSSFGTSPDVANRGELYVLFGKSSGFTPSVGVSTLNGLNGFRVSGLPSDTVLANPVSFIGDFNGDGFEDFVAGAPLAKPGVPQRPGAGAAFVIFGAASGFPADLPIIALDGQNGFRVDGLDIGDNLGSAVGAAGDVNGDGYDDLLLGAPLGNTSPSPGQSGETYVLFGRPGFGGVQFDLQSLNGQNGFRALGIAGLDKSGGAVHSAGDINGDGYDDLLIGSVFADPGATPRNSAGQTYVVLGRDFSDVVTGEGDAGDNNLLGSIQVDTMVAGAGQDNLTGAGGADVLRGGSGNDVVTVTDTAFRRVVGGTGTDTLQLEGSNLTLDLRVIPTSRLSGIEQFNLTGTGNNALQLTQRDVLRISESSNQLIIRRSDGDTVDIGTGWALTAVQNIGGLLFNVYRQGSATLLVQAVAEGAPWQNPTNHLDVTNDGLVAPEDALALINYIGTTLNANQPLPNPPVPPFAPPPSGTEFFYDVSGDGFASPLDIIIVINFLNLRAGGEGEGDSGAEDDSDLAGAGLPLVAGVNDRVSSEGGSMTAASQPTADVVSSNLLSSAAVSTMSVESECVLNSGRKVARGTTEGGPASDFEDLLAQLADDVTATWNRG